MNHFEAECLIKKIQATRSTQPKESRIITLEEEKSEDELYLQAVYVDKSDKSKNELKEIITIKNFSVNFKIDTGAQFNLIPLTLLKQPKVKGKDLKPTKTTLIAYNGTKIKPCGVVELGCVYQGKHHMIFSCRF